MVDFQGFHTCPSCKLRLVNSPAVECVMCQKLRDMAPTIDCDGCGAEILICYVGPSGGPYTRPVYCGACYVQSPLVGRPKVYSKGD